MTRNYDGQEGALTGVKLCGLDGHRVSVLLVY